MSNAHDRRAPNVARVPFEAMVEVGGSLGPSFEAQAVNLSEEGMSMRTAYLPDVGQPVMCRFDAGAGMTVVAAGEVLWKEDLGDGGEFGIRFTNLDASSTVALQRILGTADAGGLPQLEPGRKVRLHIDGLASPMRARIKDRVTGGVTAYSELGFLQMGKQVDLEDAANGARKPALIDRVQVELDQVSRIPQLIVSLRYEDDVPVQHEMPVGASLPSEGSIRTYVHGHDESVAEAEAEDAYASAPAEVEPAGAGIEARSEGTVDPESSEQAEEPGKLKAAFAKGAAKVTPAIASWAKRAKIAAALLAARAKRTGGESDVEIAPRRTTAPPPGGGLHTSGRKVVRGSVPDFGPLEEEPAAPKGRFAISRAMTKKKVGVAAAVGIAGVLAFVALQKPAPAPQLAAAPPADSATPAESLPAAATTAPSTAAKPVPPPADPLAAAAQQIAAKPGRATPFTNGPVGSKPSVIKIKMDGAIEGIQGASQPTGFTIVVPNRKSVEPTESLGSKDPRIAAIRVANESGGAEFSVAFKDGVPNYLVRAHGDVLEMVLAKEAAHGDKAEAKAKKHHGKKH